MVALDRRRHEAGVGGSDLKIAIGFENTLWFIVVRSLLFVRAHKPLTINVLV